MNASLTRIYVFLNQDKNCKYNVRIQLKLNLIMDRLQRSWSCGMKDLILSEHFVIPDIILRVEGSKVDVHIFITSDRKEFQLPRTFFGINIFSRQN